MSAPMNAGREFEVKNVWEELFICSCGVVSPAGAVWLHGDLCIECGERIKKKIIARRGQVITERMIWFIPRRTVKRYFYETRDGQKKDYNPNAGMRFWPGR